MNERVAFGLELRRIRERRGLSLEQMCGQTKVSVAHYAALESGDLSRWPSGIFRRAFVRSYATAVGLNPEEVLAEFGRIFPDPADGPRAAARIEAALREQEALAAEREAGESEEDLPVFRLALESAEARARTWLVQDRGTASGGGARRCLSGADAGGRCRRDARARMVSPDGGSRRLPRAHRLLLGQGCDAWKLGGREAAEAALSEAVEGRDSPPTAGR